MPARARDCGRFTTPHGAVELPAFMPVGTQGTVKGVDAGRLRETGAQMILANTYHLALRPGEQTVAALGGLHAFMGWDGPILTDSGGFQVFSLADRTDDRRAAAPCSARTSTARCVELTPERAVAIQEQLGSDVAMVLDHVVALPNDREVVRRRHAAQRPLGRALPSGRDARRPGAVRHRARWARRRAAGRVGRAARGARLSPATRSAA